MQTGLWLETKQDNSVELEAPLAPAEAEVGAMAKADQKFKCLYDIYRVTDIGCNKITKITYLFLFACRGSQWVQEISYFFVIHEFGWRFIYLP